MLEGATIGEIGIVYEALVAQGDHANRRAQGQFFTPDDAAHFMAQLSSQFSQGGIWLDPCCGVGNLSWHLAQVQADPEGFVRERLVLIDLDEIALLTAVSVLVFDFVEHDAAGALRGLMKRSQARNFLTESPLPKHDYVIVNPPYARAPRDSRFESAASNEYFAYFLERVVQSSSGFIAVVPASVLSTPKYSVIRDLINGRFLTGSCFVFDNVPDTLFRGYKFGSQNTSKTNFVRATIIAARPGEGVWDITPILRWTAGSRAAMFAKAANFLEERRIGPSGEWAKLMPSTEVLWDRIAETGSDLSALLASSETGITLTVATTPRYYISATKRHLDRGSKITLHFPDALTRDRAYLLLNSSLPYWWWRTLDGGVTLPRRILLSVPVPKFEIDKNLVAALEHSEARNVVVKLNAGRENQNVKHPAGLVSRLNSLVLGDTDFEGVYSPDLFVGDRDL